MQYWIMGAGGIGCALAETLAARGEQVLLLSRTRPELSDLAWSQTTWHAVDNTDASAVAETCNQYPLPATVINTLGMLQQGEQQPEKRIEQLTESAFYNSLHINTWPTLAMAQYLATRLTRTDQLHFAALSARVGSISDNRAGGWYSYRISKAALNMAIKTVSIEWQRRFPDALIVGLHPGTVATDLSAPFRAGLSEGQLHTPMQAATHLLQVLDNLIPEQSGRIWAWDGQEVLP
ncbi:SDR family NAD(P)-dependent oxidoreductase [Oceanisphaera sp. W20_SRM_FM3]|uniref:SDR family NAD(P)-dependent oxidoreductase n=1 Tax=Oceanisphaera sp. W20_SRM_FM3 TaxID=3240267 RepID=UPI003F96B759